jgi:cytochrome P450
MPKHYTMTGGPEGPPYFGMIGIAKSDPLNFFLDNSLKYGDIIPFKVMGRKLIQVNHPDLVKYVLMENNKNYVKSKAYIRFESVLGKGLLTSNGAKWKQDRQKIQPMFRRELIEGSYFAVIMQVCEKYKQRWLRLTGKGKTQIDISSEMSSITTEIILNLIFGQENLDESTITSLHHSYSTFIEYLKIQRLMPKIDLEKIFHTPNYLRFKKELKNVNDLISRLIEKHRKETTHDQYNMLALLYAAQKQDPEHFSEADIRDHAVSMVFAGFETTSVLMQWMWHALDYRPDIEEKLYSEITSLAPSTKTAGDTVISIDALENMTYTTAFFKETMRLYPPFWITSRAPVEDDFFGDYKVESGTIIMLPQIVMQRHPRWWDNGNAFTPERFMGENNTEIDNGLYFPFSQGARKCSGYKFAEIEAKVLFATFLPLFKVKMINSLGNTYDPGITLKAKKPMLAEISLR